MEDGKIVRRRFSGPLAEVDKQRFLAKLADARAVDGPLDTRCLEWAYATDNDGYGTAYLPSIRKKMLAHRLAWLLFRGEIPPKLHCLHHCDNPRCTNVDHLFLGTSKANIDDKVAKDRHAYGERHGHAALIENEVLQIHEMAWDGYNQQDIADVFGITQTTVSDIKLQKLWRHLWLRPKWSTPSVEELKTE